MAVKTTTEAEPKAEWVEPEITEVDLGIHIKSADGTILATNFETLADAEAAAAGTFGELEVEILGG